MTKKLTILTLLAAGLIFISANFTADAAVMSPDMMRHAGFKIRMAEKNLFPGHMLIKFKDEIGLTEDQLSKIEKMQNLFQEAGIRKKADIKVLELKLHSYLKAEQINRKKMEKMIRDIAKMKTDLQVDRLNYLLDLKSLLTPEQIAKIEELKKERRRHWMRQRRPGKRGIMDRMRPMERMRDREEPPEQPTNDEEM